MPYFLPFPDPNSHPIRCIFSLQKKQSHSKLTHFDSITSLLQSHIRRISPTHRSQQPFRSEFKTPQPPFTWEATLSPEQVSNYFVLSGEIMVGFLAFQGIATTFVFGRKGNWSYLDLWIFAWMIFNNLCGICACIIPVFLLIDTELGEAYWDKAFYVLFYILIACSILFLYTQYKIQTRKMVDSVTQQELSSASQAILHKFFYSIIFIPFVLPVLHYFDLLGATFIRNWVCFAPWIWSLGTFCNFFLLIDNALRVVD